MLHVLKRGQRHGAAKVVPPFISDILSTRLPCQPTFYIVGHTHKERGDFFNSRLRHLDEPISQEGQEEAHKLWSFLYDKHFSAI